MSQRYHQSEQLMARAEKTIPLGSQTFSKSRLAFPHGASPFFLERGEGAYVWDVDGHRYLDLISGLLCVSLGYQDPDVDAAVQAQLKKGVSFSLPHRLEMEVAERLVELIPCAEMVRFGKNGSDVTAAAVRLARAYTGRDHIAVCGYHGWQDWYIGSTSRDLGVPESTKALTHTFQYNDLASLEATLAQAPNQFAAVIMEPMNLVEPAPGYLQQVKALAHQHGALLVFDEIITGFRFDLHGAQGLFGVTPDLATFGKGLANGYPLSAIVGRREVMQLMEDIFFSGTFGGETLSLAAAKACLDKMQHEPVLASIHARGKQLQQGLTELTRHSSLFGFGGHPSWTLLTVQPSEQHTVFEIKSLLFQALFEQGFLTNGGHNLSYAHTEADINALLECYRTTLPWLEQIAQSGEIAHHLNAQPIEPIFAVR